VKDTLAIREGISGQDDVQANISSKAGSVKIPANFTDLEGIAT
jgi:hypothetical protein